MPLPYRTFARSHVRAETLRAVLKSVGCALDVTKMLGVGERPGQRDILLIAQSVKDMMRDDGSYGRELEVNLYRAALTEVMDKGYRVWWKDHPRQEDSIFDDLTVYFGDRLKRLHFVDQLPIELALSALRFERCVGLTSSSLFYLPKLFGTKAYTFADKLLPLVSARRAEYLVIPDVLCRVKSLHELPAVEAVS